MIVFIIQRPSAMDAIRSVNRLSTDCHAILPVGFRRNGSVHSFVFSFISIEKSMPCEVGERIG